MEAQFNAVDRDLEELMRALLPAWQSACGAETEHFALVHEQFVVLSGHVHSARASLLRARRLWSGTVSGVDASGDGSRLESEATHSSAIEWPVQTPCCHGAICLTIDCGSGDLPYERRCRHGSCRGTERDWNRNVAEREGRRERAEPSAAMSITGDDTDEVGSETISETIVEVERTGHKETSHGNKARDQKPKRK